MKTAACCKQTLLSNVLRSLTLTLSKGHPLSHAQLWSLFVLSLSFYSNVLIFGCNNPLGMQLWGLLGAGLTKFYRIFSRLCWEGPQRSSCISFLAPVRYLLPEDSNARGVISVKMAGIFRNCLYILEKMFHFLLQFTQTLVWICLARSKLLARR